MENYEYNKYNSKKKIITLPNQCLLDQCQQHFENVQKLGHQNFSIDPLNPNFHQSFALSA